jgi:LemA protein
MLTIGIVFLGVVVIILLYVVTTYNGLVQLRNAMQNAWSQVDVQLKRRHDLIPNLVETVKGYAKHERETLDAVIKARSAAMQSHSPAEQMQAENELSRALARFFVVVEQYPDLKANQNFLALQEELTSTENRIGFARQAYNDAVMQYNNKLDMFPSNIVAGMFSFQRGQFFEVETPEERQVPKVSFS